MLTNLLLLLKDAEGNDFFSAVLGFILPVAYSYQPNLTVIAVGPNRNLGISGISLIVALLQGLAESRIFAVIEVRSSPKLWYFNVSGRDAGMNYFKPHSRKYCLYLPCLSYPFVSSQHQLPRFLSVLRTRQGTTVHRAVGSWYSLAEWIS